MPQMHYLLKENYSSSRELPLSTLEKGTIEHRLVSGPLIFMTVFLQRYKPWFLQALNSSWQNLTHYLYPYSNWVWFCVHAYACMCIVWVKVHAFLTWCMCGGQRTIFRSWGPFPHYWGRVFLIPATLCKLAGDSSVSTSQFTLWVLGLHGIWLFETSGTELKSHGLSSDCFYLLCHHASHQVLFNTMLNILDSTSKGKRWNQSHADWKGRSRMLLLTDDGSVYIEHPK